MSSVPRKTTLLTGLFVIILSLAACGPYDIEDIAAIFDCQAFRLRLYIDPDTTSLTTQSLQTLAPAEPGVYLYDGAGNDLLDLGTIDEVEGEDYIDLILPYAMPPRANPITFEVLYPVGPDEYETIFYATGECADLNSQPTQFADGRVNNSLAVDSGAPVAIYVNSALSTLDIYAIDPQTGAGTLVVRHPLGDAPAPAENTLVVSVANPHSGASIEVWHLASGEYQVVTTYGGKDYSVIFPSSGTSITRVAG
jgi:hypothetical protein